MVNEEFHNTLEQVHTSFLNAGSRAITTNSYGVVPGVGFDSIEDRSKYIGLAGKIARRAVDNHNTANGGDGFVFGSLGPLVESYRADKIQEHQLGVSNYQVACDALAPSVDAFLVETMSCVEESLQAMEAVSSRRGKNQKPMLISYTLDPKGNFRDGQELIKGLERLLDHCKEKRVERK